MRFLIVDDDYDVTFPVYETLGREFGAEVSPVRTEREFRERLDEVRRSPPDLVVMDMLLPWDTPRPDMKARPEDVAEGGYESAGWRCVALLAEDARTAHVPVIIFSVVAHESRRGEGARAAGRVFYHAKPSDGRSLAGHVRAILRAESGVAVQGRSVFVVHGHDEHAAEAVARFVEKLGLRAVVLREQAAEGKTIIEQLEEHSNVAYAVVLLTPDDLGFRAGSADEPRPRARQNVIFEFGYFLGKLGRDKICVLSVEGVELPSDYGSVLFVKFDGGGAWRSRLAAEMRRAGLPADMNRMP